MAVGAGVGLAVFGAMAGSSATTRILLLWTFGLPGYLPAVVYAVVAGFLAAGLLGARRDSRDLAVGLGFLVAGGIGLQDSYQSALRRAAWRCSRCGRRSPAKRLVSGREGRCRSRRGRSGRRSGQPLACASRDVRLYT